MGTIVLPDEILVPRRRVINNLGRRDWYRIQAAAGEVAEIYIYDEIGSLGLTAKDFVADLGNVAARQINLHLNTPGGDVFDGIAIHNALVAHPAAIHVTVDGLAASIGSVIAMAGERIVMAKHSTMMIHDPYGVVIGNAADMRKMARVLDQLGDAIAGVYAERAGGTIRTWRERMLAETWLTDRQAVELGLADEVLSDAPTLSGSFDLSRFLHPPAALLIANGPLPPHRSSGVAAEDTEWDGPAEIAAAKPGELHLMCAWYDASGPDDDGDGYPDRKGDYKLPHHRHGDHHLVPAGLRAAAQRLSQTDIPAEDRAAVRRHLARHYEELGESPPWEDEAARPPGGEPTKRDIEKALRDAGLSRSQAKSLLARGWASIEGEDHAREASAELQPLLDALIRLNNRRS